MAISSNPWKKGDQNTGNKNLKVRFERCKGRPDQTQPNSELGFREDLRSKDLMIFHHCDPLPNFCQDIFKLEILWSQDWGNPALIHFFQILVEIQPTMQRKAYLVKSILFLTRPRGKISSEKSLSHTGCIVQLVMCIITNTDSNLC